ncbi:MAG: methyltransferase domain-containing protein [Anaerorhabdus sp.]
MVRGKIWVQRVLEFVDNIVYNDVEKKQGDNMSKIENYYNKFNEEKRLLSRHGQVEYITSMKYIHEVLKGDKAKKILDIGAGTGRYAVALSDEGYDVTAIELVKSNLGVLKAKKSSVKAYQGNALDLSRFQDDSFDCVLLFGPMYHLFTIDEKVKALQEAKRVIKKSGVILVAYCMNDYAVITFGFKENKIKECLEDGRITSNFKTVPKEQDLYSYVTLVDIDQFNHLAGLHRHKIISPDGHSDFMRPTLNQMDDETFDLYIQYHLLNCERLDLIGAGSHTLDIVYK